MTGEASISDRASPDHGLERQLLGTLRAGAQSCRGRVSVTLPSSAIALPNAFARFSDQPACLFAGPEGQAEVAWGAVERLSGTSIADLAAVRKKAEGLLSEVTSVGPEASARTSRLYGGLAYARAPRKEGPWRHFGALEFVWPRSVYWTDGRRATLTVNARTSELGDDAQVRHLVRSVLSELCAAPASACLLSAAPAQVARRDLPDQPGWCARVEAARQLLETGVLNKVVLARQIELELKPAPLPHRVLGRLMQQPEDSRVFAIRRGPTTFLGASPERLVVRAGSEILTEALAGSIRAASPGAGTMLQQNDKEQREHEWVVRELIQRLAALGALANSPGKPAIRRLRHVLHLQTPLQARLQDAPHVLDLVAALHPTPAVGGTPPAAAERFILEQELAERGWYAGPVGWFDAHGDGEFLVAIRSGLIEGGKARVFAGAGLVIGSEPMLEWSETELKLSSFLEALGLAVD